MQSPSFLQVTINTEKLNDFLKQIKFLLKEQASTIQQHHRKFTFANNSFNERFTRVQFQLEQKYSKLKKQIISQALIQKNLLYKTQNKLEIKIKEIMDRLLEIKTTTEENQLNIGLVSQKAGQLYQECKEIKNIKMKNEEFQQSLKNINSQLYAIMKEQKNDLKTNDIVQICQQTFFKILQNDRVRNLVKDGNFVRKPQPKKSCFNQNQALFYASISQKLEKLEKQLLEKGNQSINKIIYPTSNFKQHAQRQDKQNPIFYNQALKAITVENSQYSLVSRDIKGRLQSIQKILMTKNQNAMSEILQQKDKVLVLSEKIQILTRRLQKQKLKQTQLSNSVKRLAQKRIDQKMIDNFRFQIRKKTMDYQQNLDSKISRDIYQKQRAKLNDRLKIIHENLVQKAEKSEVIKAIKFLQEKIKQIIFLIAGSKDDDKQEAIKKKNFTCLSCDKQLQSKLSILNQGAKLKNSESMGTMMRTTTSRMRRHIRLASTNMTPQNID